MSRAKTAFTVDTHVFRELGELLVGRDSTALLELIKNSYDADATEIVVTAVDLGTPKRGRIVIQDNGSGMDESQFTRGFLRIASRFKEEGARRSAFFRRRYTGSKGIGRLAAHKLAKVLDVYSVSGNPTTKSNNSITAQINWDEIEAKETLDELSSEVSLESAYMNRAVSTGTVITLSKLRRGWTDKERTRFVTECRSFQVPAILSADLPTRIVSRELLFTSPEIRDATNKDPGCDIKLEGEFSEGDSYWEPLVDATNWVLEIDCRSEKGIVRYAIAPSKASIELYPEARRRIFKHSHPHPQDGPFFQARVLVRDESLRSKNLRELSRRANGVRVYLEGFRVLPYGDAGDDWLRLDADLARRSWQTDQVFARLIDSETEHAGDWQLSMLPNSSYTGAVFLTQDDAPSLRLLVNREGFVADRAFDTIVDIVRRGIDLLTRTRAAAKAPARKRQREEREQTKLSEEVGPKGKGTAQEAVDSNVVTGSALADATAQAMESVKEARRLLSAGADTTKISQRLNQTQSAISQVVSAADQVRDSSAMLRVLASLGTQMASFVHEIRGLLGTAIAVHEAVGRIRKDFAPRDDVRSRLNEVFQSLGDMRRQIERQAAYLIDLTSPDARRRRSRQLLRERFDAAAKLVAPAVERLEIRLLNQIPEDLKSPPLFQAELTAVFSNLLTNAVKASGKGGTIRARAEPSSDGGCSIIIENTGVEVDLSKAERWFEPFESTTAEVDSALGQGMGLGLTITRDVLDQYGATIRFIEPSSRFSTAIEIQFPG